jgi:HSP20 family protein
MTLLTRWEPTREYTNLQNQMNRLLAGLGPASDDLMSTGFVPAVDIYEDEHAITLKVEVPGIEEKDIEVLLENQTLTLRGERKFEKEEKEENFHRIERRYGSFTRSFTLPNTVDSENVKAEYANGVLSVRLPKRAEAKPRQIKVGVTQKPAKAA